jgi:hypothetical protein
VRGEAGVMLLERRWHYKPSTENNRGGPSLANAVRNFLWYFRLYDVYHTSKAMFVNVAYFSRYALFLRYHSGCNPLIYIEYQRRLHIQNVAQSRYLTYPTE